MSFTSLFRPMKIRGLELKNRIIFPAMATLMDTEDSYVSQQLIDYHVARAKGGNALNILEACSVHAPSSPKRFVSLSDDKFIPKMKELTDAVHEAGGKMSVQLWQGGIAVSVDPTARIIVPSDLSIPGTEYRIPAVTKETIHEIVKSFGRAARRAVDAGFDSIEFHAAHNYSPHAFLSPAFNKRTDEYGGSFENRARYLIECIEAIRENIPEDMPLFMRIGAHDDYLENGLRIEDVIDFCKLAEKAGVDVLDVSRGNTSSAAIVYEVPPLDIPRGFNVHNAEIIRKETGMITMAVGRINDPEQADEIIANGQADLVGIGRAQLADPEFANKAKSGNVDKIVRCVGCNQGCFDIITIGLSSPDAVTQHITCLRNPALGKEKKYVLEKTDTPRKVLIVGGGIAGLEAAITLKRRGHEPIVCEATAHLGGQFILAGLAPRKEELMEAAIWMGETAVNEGVEIRLSTPVTVELLKEIKPDDVIVAVGAKPKPLNIPIRGSVNIVSSHDVLRGEIKAEGDVVIIGGGLVGLEVAEFLAEKKECIESITVVEMQEEVGLDLGQLRKISVMQALQAAEVELLTNASCNGINHKKVSVDHAGEVKLLHAHTLINATGVEPNDYDEIEVYCIQNEIPCHIIGDAYKGRRALESIAEAAIVARAI